jgi:hypothetical protein
VDDVLTWNGNWAWSLPLIVLSVIFHVIGLGFINAKVLEVHDLVRDRRHRLFAFALVMGVTTLMATILHAIEATIWAGAYRLLGALPDTKLAMLYSLSAMTSYGHADIFLAMHWQLMGALEALNGMILLGLTTAFLYGTIQRVWPLESRTGHHLRAHPAEPGDTVEAHLPVPDMRRKP